MTAQGSVQYVMWCQSNMLPNGAPHQHLAGMWQQSNRTTKLLSDISHHYAYQVTHLKGLMRNLANDLGWPFANVQHIIVDVYTVLFRSVPGVCLVCYRMMTKNDVWWLCLSSNVMQYRKITESKHCWWIHQFAPTSNPSPMMWIHPGSHSRL